MTPVDILFVKYPDTRHWNYRMYRFAVDDYGTWLGGRAGDTARRGDEPPTTFRYPFVKLIGNGSWSTPLWNAGGRIALYVDIVAPAIWDGYRVKMVDLDLDVVELFDGHRYLDDEDEFLEHQEVLGYPPRLVDGARAAAARVITDMERGAEPYATAGPARLAEWLRLIDG